MNCGFSISERSEKTVIQRDITRRAAMPQTPVGVTIPPRCSGAWYAESFSFWQPLAMDYLELVSLVAPDADDEGPALGLYAA